MNQKLKNLRLYQIYWWKIRPHMRTVLGKIKQMFKEGTEAALELLYAAVRFLRRKKIWEIYSSSVTESSYEDPKCPIEWIGSGCYDIDVYTLNARLFIVTARDRREALRIRMKQIEKDVQEEVGYKMKRMKEEMRNSVLSDARCSMGWWDNIDLIRQNESITVKGDEACDVDTVFVKDGILTSERESEVDEYTVDDLVQEFAEDLQEYTILRNHREFAEMYPQKA